MRIPFRTVEINGKREAMADWPKLHKAAAKHNRGYLEVTEVTEAMETTAQQIKYFHAVPVKLYAQDQGFSTKEAELRLKVECGENLFVLEYADENMSKGEFWFSCDYVHCKHVFKIPSMDSYFPGCPMCNNGSITPHIIRSKTDLTVAEFNEFIENCYSFLNSINIRCEMPNKDWRNETSPPA